MADFLMPALGADMEAGKVVEWLVAVTSGAAADDFLGTQGDPWDTQTDMAMALVGASFAVLVMTRWHDRSLARLAARAQ